MRLSLLIVRIHMRSLKLTFFTGWFLIALAAFSVQATEEKRVEPALVSLRVIPESPTLSGAQASQQFVVLGQYADGLERDLTSSARFSLSDASKGEIDSSGKFVARSSGALVLTEGMVAPPPKLAFVSKRPRARAK